MSNTLISSTAAILHDLGNGFWGSRPFTPPPPVSGFPLSLALSTAGRVGFYVDYSELSGVGNHTFYICRTHGTVGQVSVDYSTAGDAHTATSGTLTWEDTEADIKVVTVSVPSKGAGDHRITMTLSNPTGGLVLHHGADTEAHGVIDDDTIATTNAIFIDADSGTDGIGTEDNPFNNWYSARAAVTSSTRYVYVKGFMVPDGTDVGDGSGNVRYLGVEASTNVAGNGFVGRSSNLERLYIRAWPGFTGGVSAGGQTIVTGFRHYHDATDYITYRKLSFLDVDSSTMAGGKGYSIRFSGGGGATHKQATMELCSHVGNIAYQPAAASAIYCDGETSGLKIWRNSFDDITHVNGEFMHGLETYGADKLSMQRCTLSDTVLGAYSKNAPVAVGNIAWSLRFNDFDTGYIRLSTQGGDPMGQASIIQSNLIRNTRNGYYPPLQYDTNGPSLDSEKQWIVGNVFYNFDYSTFGSVTSRDPDILEHIMFNNIFSEQKIAWYFETDSVAPEYADYNHYFNSSQATIVDLVGTRYYGLSGIQAGTIYEDSGSEGDPTFTNTSSGDFSLQSGSPAEGNGVSGTDKGLYLTGIEKIGASA